MMKSSRIHLSAGIVSTAALFAAVFAPLTAPAASRDRGGTPSGNKGLSQGAKKGIKASLGAQALGFVENRGQVDASVSHYLQGADTSFFFSPAGITYSLAGAAKGPRRLSRAYIKGSFPAKSEKLAAGRYGLKLDFVDANPVVPVASDKTPTAVSYFKGPADQWKTGLSTYSSLTYPNLWPGIDLSYSGTGQNLKYTFHVKPGADPSDIRLAYRGASSLNVNTKGQLKVSTPGAVLTDDRPVSFQQIGGKRIKVESSYALSGASSDKSRAYGFSVGDYDRTKPLVIDPVVLVYAGFIGGEQTDLAYDVAVDNSGAAYVAGQTNSIVFPTKIGPNPTNKGSNDAFVVKVNPDGKTLDYAGFIGGLGVDSAFGLAVDESGAYVVGSTTSNQSTFPVIGGPDLTHNAGQDAFITKVAPDGRTLLYSGFIGGGGDDVATGVAVDGLGAAYLSGYTTSNAASFPVKKGPYLTDPVTGFGGAFAAKVNSNGAALDYAGYIGSGNGYAVAVDDSGSAYVIGDTGSPRLPPTVDSDLQPRMGGDAYIVKIRADGTALVYAGYIGGDGTDHAYGVAVDRSGAAYVTGFTPEIPPGQTPFPVVNAPPSLGSPKGSHDAYIAKVNPDGASFAYSVLIGGSQVEMGNDIAVDLAGAAYITGHTASTESNSFPVTKGPDLTHNGGSIDGQLPSRKGLPFGGTGSVDSLIGASNFDAFVAKLSPSAQSLEYAGYVGGPRTDVALGIAVDIAGAAYVGGTTDSPLFPATSSPDLPYKGGLDAFVAKVANLPILLSVSDLSLPEGNLGQTEFSFSVSLSIPSPTPVDITFSTANGTATADDNDFLPKTNQTITIPPGQTSAQLSVSVVADTVLEPDEQFSLNITSSSEVSISKGVGVGVIRNDDPVPPPVDPKEPKKEEEIIDRGNADPNRGTQAPAQTQNQPPTHQAGPAQTGPQQIQQGQGPPVQAGAAPQGSTQAAAQSQTATLPQAQVAAQVQVLAQPQSAMMLERQKEVQVNVGRISGSDNGGKAMLASALQPAGNGVFPVLGLLFMGGLMLAWPRRSSSVTLHEAHARIQSGPNSRRQAGRAPNPRHRRQV